MNDLDIELNPGAVSYYDRLGVDPTADVKTIRKAGKFAFMKYAERDREAFLALRSAREALQDSQTREVYDEFCEELGADLGTRAFETWKAKASHKSPDEIIELVREDEDQERATPEDKPSLWDKLDVKDPQVVWANQPFSQSISVNLWTKAGKRLYINNLYYEGSIYLDLTSGEFYTEDYEYIPNMTYRVLDDGLGLYIEGSEKKIKIDLRSSRYIVT